MMSVHCTKRTCCFYTFCNNIFSTETTSLFVKSTSVNEHLRITTKEDSVSYNH